MQSQKPGGIEADVLEDVVVNPVVEHSKAAAQHDFLGSEQVPREANTRTKIVVILGPYVRVALLEGTGCFPGIKRIIDGEVRVGAGSSNGCCGWPKVKIRIQPILEVMRRSEIFPAQAKVHREARNEFSNRLEHRHQIHSPGNHDRTREAAHW